MLTVGWGLVSGTRENLRLQLGRGLVLRRRKRQLHAGLQQFPERSGALIAARLDVGIDPVAVHDSDLARALPASADVPEWARSWRRSHRLLVGLFDTEGRGRSLIARSIDREARVKSLAPKGYARRGQRHHRTRCR